MTTNPEIAQLKQELQQAKLDNLALKTKLVSYQNENRVLRVALKNAQRKANNA